jgi:hypothetical protein
MRLSVSGENRSTGWKPPTCRKSLTNLYHIMLYRVHHAWAWFELITVVVIDTDCTGSCKSNYHAIMKLKSQCYRIIVCRLWRISALLRGFFGGNQNIPGLQSALKLADKDLYPNIHTIFKLLIVQITVTSVCCKRSLSALRRLKTRVRSTMRGERLCGWAKLHSHRNMAVNWKKHFKTIWCLWWLENWKIFHGQLRHVQILILLTIT